MPVPAGYSMATLGEFVGHDFGLSAPVMVGQERIDAFADTTGDRQWIHVDVERAERESPFGGPVAHGFLTLSLLAAEVFKAGCIPPDARGAVNYGLENFRFLSPVPAGAALVCGFRLAAVEDKGKGRHLLRIASEARIDGTDKPAVVGEILALAIQ